MKKRIGKVIESKLLPLFATRKWIIGATAAAVLLLSLGIRTPFFMDDYLHQAMMEGTTNLPWKPVPPWALYTMIPGDPGFMERSIALGSAPWWANRSFQATFFRPLGSLSLYLDHLLFPGSAVWAHVTSLLWFLFVLASVALLYRRLETNKTASGLAFPTSDRSERRPSSSRTDRTCSSPRSSPFGGTRFIFKIPDASKSRSTPFPL